MDTKKYIIEIPDNTAWIQWVKVSDKDGHVYFDFKDPEDLTPYTEPDLEQVRKEAYEEGYKLGYYSDGYQRGLNDAWDAARKIYLTVNEGGLSANALTIIFGNKSMIQIFKELSASEAIEKIRQYEQKQEKIKVGDEVEWNGENYVVTYIHCDNEYVDALDCSNGSVCDNLSIKAVKKTGRHFPEIAEVLRKMQEEKE